MAKENDYLLSVGVMTGNSLDAADLVLTRFDNDKTITDIKGISVALPQKLVNGLRHLRACVETNHGFMEKAIALFNGAGALAINDRAFDFDTLLASYTKFVADAITQLINTAKVDAPEIHQVDLIGFHGQTLAHCPPSIAKTHDPQSIYTVQLGDGQALSNLTGIPVVYDFRSDDLMNGGEGAPLAPAHHAHLAKVVRKRGDFPIAFCNAGNTGNLTVVTVGPDNKNVVVGWDTGPFNHFTDQLMQRQLGKPYDSNGEVGRSGRVDSQLLRKLFEQAVITQNSDNFLLCKPPKSSDPTWYLLKAFDDDNSGESQKRSFEDTLCTAQYFAAYVFVHSLTFLSKDLKFPDRFALSGGGWKNENTKRFFADLLCGDLKQCTVLSEHMELFKQLRLKIEQDNHRSVSIKPAIDFGFDGAYMEARLMADAAVCRVKGIPFTQPSITGTKQDTILGIIRFPNADAGQVSDRLKAILDKNKSRALTLDNPKLFNPRWSRASAGWFNLVNAKTAF